MQKELDKIFQIEYSLCIIGSGPTGIILALEYSHLNPGKSVLLVEYGYKHQNGSNELDDSILNTNPLNHHDPYECTNKGLGGTSLTWGGRCVMYDEVDFIDRPIIQGGCTWDISLYNDVCNHLERTAYYFECGAPIFNLDQVAEFKSLRVSEKFKEGDVKDSALEKYSMPTRFGQRYKNELDRLPNLNVVEGFEARDFSSPDENGTVSTLIIRHVTSRELKKIKAKRFVLAAGAQESTRILLRNSQLFQNIGGKPKSLGKYYQSHLSGKIASVQFYGDPQKTNFSFLRDRDGIYMRRRFQFSTKYLVESNLLNTAIWLDNPLYFDPKHKSGSMSLMYLAMLLPFIGKKLAPPAIGHSITKGKVSGISAHLLNIIKGLPGSITTPASIFFRRYLLKRKLPGVFLYNPDNCYALHFHSEQIPIESNSMELGKDKETLIINYELTDEDILSIIALHQKLDEYLQEIHCGKLNYWYSKDKLFSAIKSMSKDGIHQSGTTRISDTYKNGVVDRDLKVWGTSNVYVCSSSVFPTSSQANPTFFLGAFAVRLANHLTAAYEKN